MPHQALLQQQGLQGVAPLDGRPGGWVNMWSNCLFFYHTKVQPEVLLLMEVTVLAHLLKNHTGRRAGNNLVKGIQLKVPCQEETGETGSS